MRKMFLVLAMALLFGAVFAGLSLPSYTVTPATVKPGGSGVITLLVSNPATSSTGTGDKVSAIGLTMNPASVIDMTDRVTVGDLDVGSTTAVSIPFSVKPGTKSGIYVVEIRAKGFTATGTVAGSTGQYNFQATSIPVSVVDSPILTLSTSKELVKDTEPLTLTIKNNGGQANRVRISVNSTKFAMIGQDEAFIDSVKESAGVNITLDSRNAAGGANDVVFTVRYQDELGNSLTEQKSMRITVKKESLDMDFTQKSEIFTGKDSTLVLGINNRGTKTLEDVKVSFGTTSLKLKDASEFKLGNIAPGQATEISLPVFADLTPGTNYVNFNVKYTDGNVEKEQTVSVPLTITSDADVAVYITANPTPLASGQYHTLSVLVSNLGSYEISNVDVSISSAAFENLDVHSREYIGSLDKGDFSTVQFKVKVKDVAAGDYPLNMTVNYRDKSGEWKTKVINDSVAIHAPVQQANGLVYYIGGIVALAAIALWYFKFRKKPQPQTRA